MVKCLRNLGRFVIFETVVALEAPGEAPVEDSLERCRDICLEMAEESTASSDEDGSAVGSVDSISVDCKG